MASKHRTTGKPSSGTALLQLVREEKRRQAIAEGRLREYGMVGQRHAPTRKQETRRARRAGRAQAQDWE